MRDDIGAAAFLTHPYPFPHNILSETLRKEVAGSVFYLPRRH
jgi:hypothetical protein